MQTIRHIFQSFLKKFDCKFDWVRIVELTIDFRDNTQQYRHLK